MTHPDLIARSGNACEFCGEGTNLQAATAPGGGEILLCALCREEVPAPAAHWRCLEGAAWSAERAVQSAVLHKLATIDAPWAKETRAGMVPPQRVLEQAGLDPDPGPGPLEHRDCNGVLLAQGDTVVLIKDLTVKGAGFTAKRGTAVRGISLVIDNAAQIEGRVEGQRIVILTEFVKKH